VGSRPPFASSAFVGLIAGYFVGYRSGQVAGELAALKSILLGRQRPLPPPAKRGVFGITNQVSNCRSPKPLRSRLVNRSAHFAGTE